MNGEWVLIDREALLVEMQQVFDARTADVLLRVLDKVAAQVRQAGVTREDFGELKQIVAELAEAQRRTTEEMKKLVAAQTRTEERIDRLAEAQARTEERVGRLEAAMEQLAEAQRQTSAAVSELTAGIDRLRNAIRSKSLDAARPGA